MGRRITCLFVALVLGCSFRGYGQIGAHARRVLGEPINEASLMPLKGNVRPEASAANDNGPVLDDFQMDHLFLQLRRPPDQQRALEQFIEELHQHNSPNFHRWLTPQQFGERFGLAKQDLDTVTSWLEGHGLIVNAVYPNLVVDFSGTAGQIREAFHTPIHRLFANGQRHYANMSNPEIPAALYPAVIGITSLHNFGPHSLAHAVSSYTITPNSQKVVPADLAKIYNFSAAFAAGYSGQGQTIVLLENSDIYSEGDWLVFRKVFGLTRNYPEGNLVTLHPQGAGNTCRDPHLAGDETEAIIDAEWATAAAPNATIEIASCADTSNFGGFIALQNLLISNDGAPPSIVSLSFGEPEPLLGEAANAFINSLYQLAVAEGVSIFAASGDGGAAFSDSGLSAAVHGLAVNGYASTPYNVAVGGTDFADTYLGTTVNYWNPGNSPVYGSAMSYIPEIPWNDSCASELLAMSAGFATTYGFTGYCNRAGPHTTLAASGGPSGCATGLPDPFGVVGNMCRGYPKPSWQAVAGNPNDGVRDLPDVSLFASNGRWGHSYVVCFSDVFQGGISCLGAPSSWAAFGGTSLSSPIMAGTQALVNQASGSRWGNPNTIYYKLAAAQYANGNSACGSSDTFSFESACTFHDIVFGDITVDCIGSNNCFLGPPPVLYGVLSNSNGSYEPAYRATIGWDFATGIGSIQVWNLLTNWSAAIKESDIWLSPSTTALK
jgi:subtilase family serine protease